MKAQHIIYTWDYHHGQATRVIMSGLPPLRGRTMREKQDDFQKRCDYVRTSLMQEPRGHKNMLGAVVLDGNESMGLAPGRPVSAWVRILNQNGWKAAALPPTPSAAGLPPVFRSVEEKHNGN